MYVPTDYCSNNNNNLTHLTSSLIADCALYSCLMDQYRCYKGYIGTFATHYCVEYRNTFVRSKKNKDQALRNWVQKATTCTQQFMLDELYSAFEKGDTRVLPGSICGFMDSIGARSHAACSIASDNSICKLSWNQIRALAKVIPRHKDNWWGSSPYEKAARVQYKSIAVDLCKRSLSDIKKNAPELLEV